MRFYQSQTRHNWLSASSLTEQRTARGAAICVINECKCLLQARTFFFFLNFCFEAYVHSSRTVWCSTEETSENAQLICTLIPTARLSPADMQLHDCRVLPQLPPPPPPLASPHPSSQMKSCQNVLARISFSSLPLLCFFPSPLVPLSVSLPPSSSLHLSAERQLRQTSILDEPVRGGVFRRWLGSHRGAEVTE